jgi:hypothetical protein
VAIAAVEATSNRRRADLIAGPRFGLLSGTTTEQTP